MRCAAHWKLSALPARCAGFDDRGILQITLIASWFNYINRVADSLGVGRDASPRVGER